MISLFHLVQSVFVLRKLLKCFHMEELMIGTRTRRIIKGLKCPVEAK